jgi:ABC-type multidrug transport system ATPase subunit
MNDVLLEVKNVAKSFRPEVFEAPIQSLKGITLKFPKGQCTGLVGHNGAGKTTTIRLILGLTRPDLGHIELNGKPVNITSRRNIGYLAESVKFPAGLTSEEILSTHLALFNVGTRASRKSLIKQKLDSVGLGPFAKRKAKSMSKGMQQRLAWAQATIHDPDLLILDEPFSGLDPIGRLTMKNWILEEKKRGLTMILCTHELPQITSLCDQIHILRKGDLVYTSVQDFKRDATMRDLPRYFLDLSGPTMEQIQKVLLAKKLPPWKTHHQEGFLHRLGFASYGDAIAWLNPATEAGWVLVRFGDDQSATEDQLLVHFKEEFTQ